MGSPYGMDGEFLPMGKSDPQDSLSDVLTNGPSLELFEYLTRDSYFSEGLYSFKKHQEVSGYQGNQVINNFERQQLYPGFPSERDFGGFLGNSEFEAGMSRSGQNFKPNFRPNFWPATTFNDWIQTPAPGNPDQVTFSAMTSSGFPAAIQQKTSVPHSEAGFQFGIHGNSPNNVGYVNSPPLQGFNFNSSFGPTEQMKTQSDLTSFLDSLLETTSNDSTNLSDTNFEQMVPNGVGNSKDDTTGSSENFYPVKVGSTESQKKAAGFPIFLEKYPYANLEKDPNVNLKEDPNVNLKEDPNANLEGDPNANLEDPDFWNYEDLDLSGLNELEGYSLMDIIEADMADSTEGDENPKTALVLEKFLNSDTQAAHKAENNPVDLTRNQYFLQDKDTDKNTRLPRGKKSSMARIDGHAILLRCQVCSGRASGFHYGVDTCGACKIFFARYHQGAPPHTCVDRVTGKVLKYNSRTAGSCPGCRLQKCFTVGMDIKASKKGRYSYKRKFDYIRRTKEENKMAVLPVSIGDVIDDVIIMASHISDLFLSCKTYRPDFFQKVRDMELKCLEYKKFKSIQQLKNQDQVTGQIFPVGYGPFDELNSQRFNSLDRRIKTYVSFARKIPGFSDLPKEDQVSIVKGAAVFLSKISEYRAYNVNEGLEVSPEGLVVHRDIITKVCGKDYVDRLFKLSEQLQKLHLNENERNLLKCVAFFSSEFCSTAAGRTVTEKHQDAMIKAFAHLVRRNRVNNPRENSGKVIGNAMHLLGQIHVFKFHADRTLIRITREFPSVKPGLVLEFIDWYNLV